MLINYLSLFMVLLFVSVSSLAQYIPDAAIKKNISPIDSPLQKLMQLSPSIYEYDNINYKYLHLQPGKHYGFIAEDLQAIFPGLIKEKSVSYMFGKNVYRNARIKLVDEGSLIAVMVAAIKEQQLEIERMKVNVQELKSQLATFNK